MRYLWMIGLLLALSSAIALVVLPPEVPLLPGLAALAFGMAIFGVGVLLRFWQQKVDIGMAMRCFAEANDGDFQEFLSVDQLPGRISLIQCGEHQRCSDNPARR